MAQQVGFGDALSIIANVCQVLGVPGLITIAVLWWNSARLAKRREKALAQAVIDSENLISQLREELNDERARADRYDPLSWLSIYRRERADSNEAKALDALREGTLRTSDAMHEVYFELARHHVALYPDNERPIHLREAQRLARIANQLKPTERRAQVLLEDLDAAVAMRLPREIVASSWKDVPMLDALRFGGGLGIGAAENLLRELDAATKNELALGRYQIAERVAHRARTVALAEMGEAAPMTSTVRHNWAMCLFHCGLHDEALLEVDALLPVIGRVRGHRHYAFLITRFLRAMILEAAKRRKEALQETESMLRTFEGLNARKLLPVRQLRADILKDLGRNEEALSEIEAVLQAWGESPGESDMQSYLVARLLRGELLSDIGRGAEGLCELEALVDIRTKRDGAEHPQTLTVRFYRAVVLEKLGRYDEMLLELESLHPTRNRISGPEHPDSLATHSLYADALNRVGRHREALHELDTLVPISLRALGPEHWRTLGFQLGRAHVLSHVGRNLEALEVLEAILPILKRAQNDERKVVAADQLRQSILRKLGEKPLSGGA